MENKYVSVNEIIWLIVTKMRLKKKNRSHKYDICRTNSRYGYKYAKNKMCLSIMTVIYIKQYLSNIWSSIHEKIKQHWGWAGKKAFLYKKAFIPKTFNLVTLDDHPLNLFQSLHRSMFFCFWK